MAINNALTCQEAIELVTEYLEHALPAAERKLLEEHLADCPGCEMYLEQIRRTIALLHVVAQERTSPAKKQRLLQFFESWKLRDSVREGKLFWVGFDH